MKIIVRTTEMVPVKLGVKFKVLNGPEWMDCSFSHLSIEVVQYHECVGEAFNECVRCQHVLLDQLLN